MTAVCGCCGGPVPEPDLWLVPTPNGPRDACGLPAVIASEATRNAQKETDHG